MESSLSMELRASSTALMTLSRSGLLSWWMSPSGSDLRLSRCGLLKIAMISTCTTSEKCISGRCDRMSFS